MEKLYKTGLNIDTFEASALLGLRIKYSEKAFDTPTVKKAIKKVCAKLDYAFSGTLTPTKIAVFSKNRSYEENGLLIWSSIYARFPVEKDIFKKNFIQFIGELATELKQERISVNFTDESLMVETKYCEKPDLQ